MARLARPCAVMAPAASAAARSRARSSTCLGGDDLVDEADGQRLVGPHLPAGEDQVLGSARADQAGQPLRAAAARDDAEQDLGLAEPGLLAGDAEVAGQRQLATAAEREAGDRRDGGPRDVGHRVERPEEKLPMSSASARVITSSGASAERNSEISAPAAKMRSPPVTTTAPGGSSRSPSATAVSWRSTAWTAR